MVIQYASRKGSCRRMNRMWSSPESEEVRLMRGTTNDSPLRGPVVSLTWTLHGLNAKMTPRVPFIIPWSLLRFRRKTTGAPTRSVNWCGAMPEGVRVFRTSTG